MSDVYDKSIIIQKINESTEEWKNVFNKPLHACINKTKSDNKYLSTGAIQAKRNLTFKLRYFKDLEDISFNLQKYRIVYNNVTYDIVDYDDFKLQHKTVKLLGVSY